MKAKGPSLRDIAERSGVHQSTVSRVLKNDTRISAATAEKVQAAAKALGYVPDPHLVKLMAHMRGMREQRFESVIGFLLPEVPYPDAFARSVLEGALTRTQELGYVVDRFPVDMSPESIRRLNRILQARGIEGLLLLPQVKNTSPPELDMSKITVVSVTTFMDAYPVHEVLPDHVHNMERIRQALVNQKARRPGLISWPDLDRRQHHAGPRMLYQYAYETLQKHPLPSLIWKGTDDEIESAFQNWFKKYKPDALLIPNPLMCRTVRKIVTQMGLEIPPCYATAHHGENFPGIDQQPEEIGRAAIDMLTAHMQRNEKDWPRVTKHMLIPGKWVD